MRSIRSRSLVFVALPALAIILSGGICDSPTNGGSGGSDVPGKVENLELTVNSDGTLIRLQWERPVYGDPRIDGYKVRFMTIDGRKIWEDTVGSNYVFHDPAGELGAFEYRVAAYNEDGNGEESVYPYASPTLVRNRDFHDIHCDQPRSYCGLDIRGDQSSGPIDLKTGGIVHADIYMSNMSSDTDSQPYYLKTPGNSQRAPDNDVAHPATNLRVAGCHDLGGNPPHTVPDCRGEEYPTFLEITAGHFYAVCTEDSYYGVIYIHEINPADCGHIRISYWRPKLQAYRVFAIDSPPTAP